MILRCRLFVLHIVIQTLKAIRVAADTAQGVCVSDSRPITTSESAFCIVQFGLSSDQLQTFVTYKPALARYTPWPPEMLPIRLPQLKSPIDDRPPEDRVDHPTFCNQSGRSTGLWGLYIQLWGLPESPQPLHDYWPIQKTPST